MTYTCHNGYCHATPGRIRVRVTNLKNNREAAKSLQVLMASQPGIKHVCANPVTGNVLVHYDTITLSHDGVLKSLADLGHYPRIAPTNTVVSDEEAALSDIGMKLAKVALKQVLSGTPAAIIFELL